MSVCMTFPVVFQRQTGSLTQCTAFRSCCRVNVQEQLPTIQLALDGFT